MIIKPLEDSSRARTEIYLHWRACKESTGVVQIKEVYENNIGRITMLYVVMEW
jgi:hypothetical protein